jgi:hypothetical protein
MFREKNCPESQHITEPSETYQKYDAATLAASSAYGPPIITVGPEGENETAVETNGMSVLQNTVSLSRVSSEQPFTSFSRSTRIFIVFMVAVSALISPFAATLYYPALNPLAQQLDVSSSLINLSITTYMVRHID